MSMPHRTSSVVLCGSLLLAACQSTRSPTVPEPMPLWRITQVGHGEDARFVMCTVMTCPAVTAKTLARTPEVIQPRRVQVAFSFASAELDAQARETLDHLIPQLPGVQSLTLKGYTDSIGAAAVNQRLSLQRAESVRDYLLREALAPAPTISVEGHGACCFIATNGTPQGRQSNRRVEIQLDFRRSP